ncbi:MAG TPA: hypothetical protein VG917_06130 [Patescibacteria group bacterium]|nr:hypothetical protein [Patescibacteria group bacterium]
MRIKKIYKTSPIYHFLAVLKADVGEEKRTEVESKKNYSTSHHIDINNFLQMGVSWR